MQWNRAWLGGIRKRTWRCRSGAGSNMSALTPELLIWDTFGLLKDESGGSDPQRWTLSPYEDSQQSDPRT